MNEIKKMDLDKQLVELDKYFNKIGMTQKLIDEMGGTTLGIWAQIKETANVVMRTMGQPALERIRTFLSGIRDGMTSVKEVVADRNFFTPEEFREKYNRAMAIENFKETGGRIIDNIVSGLLSSAHKIGAWFMSIQQNPEFQKQTTLFGQVKFVIEDIYQRFLAWLDGGGRDKITKTTANLIQILIAGIEASIENILPVAVKVGNAIAKGVMEGFSSTFSNSWVAQLISDPVGYGLKKLTGGKLNLLDHGKRTRDKLGMKGAAGPLPYNGFDKITRQYPKRNGGLNYVRNDGDTYSLHRGEMILPRGEADNYRKGKSGGGNTYNFGDIVINGGPTDRATVIRLLDAISNEIEAAGGAGA